MPFLHERWICPLQRLFPFRLKVMETQFKVSRKQILYVSFVYLVMLSTVQIIHYSLIGSLINNGLERCTRKWSWPNLRYSPGICLAELMKTTNNLSGLPVSRMVFELRTSRI
jgi:hypothetical protein